MPYFVVEREANPLWTYSGKPSENHCIIGYAKSGKAYYNVNGRSITVSKGNVLFFAMDQDHRAQSDPDDPWSFYSISFSVDFKNEYSKDFFMNLPNVFRCSDSLKLSSDFSELNRTWTTKPKGYRLKCRSLILDIIYIILTDEDRRRFSSAHFERISEIIDMIREDFTKNWSVSELSALSGLSQSHFRLLFKQMTGLTTVQFQNDLRIDKAKDLLLSKSCNVTEAAYAVGFNDVYYFSRLFKKRTGRNPSEFT